MPPIFCSLIFVSLFLHVFMVNEMNTLVNSSRRTLLITQPARNKSETSYINFQSETHLLVRDIFDKLLTDSNDVRLDLCGNFCMFS